MKTARPCLRPAALPSMGRIAILALLVCIALGLAVLGCGSPSPTPEIPSATPYPNGRRDADRPVDRHTACP